MKHSANDLYQLLPAVYRDRDRLVGSPLEALLQVVGEQWEEIRDDIDGMYRNWFIETCEDWVTPYLAELVGLAPPTGSGGPADPEDVRSLAAYRALYPRREVLEAVRLRRRKGTLAALAELPPLAANWQGRAVESIEHIVILPSVRYPGRATSLTFDVRNCTARARWGGAFESTETPRLPDVRRARSQSGFGWAKLRQVLLFVWRRFVVPVVEQTPSEPTACGVYYFHRLGARSPLYVATNRNGVSDRASSESLDEFEAPQPLRRAMLSAVNNKLVGDSGSWLGADRRYYGLGKSFLIEQRIDGCWRAIPAQCIVTAALDSECPAMHKGATTRMLSARVLVDPEIGAFRFENGRAPAACDLRVTFHRGLISPIGGGAYSRGAAPSTRTTFWLDPSIGPGSIDLSATLEKAGEIRRLPSRPEVSQPKVVVMFPDCRTIVIGNDRYLWTTPCIEVSAGKTLEIRAFDQTGPLIELCPGGLSVRLGSGSKLIFDGLTILGVVRIERVLEESEAPQCDDPNDFEPSDWKPPAAPRVEIRHCTMTAATFECNKPGNRCLQRALDVCLPDGVVCIQNSIIGGVVWNDPCRENALSRVKATVRSFWMMPPIEMLVERLAKLFALPESNCFSAPLLSVADSIVDSFSLDRHAKKLTVLQARDLVVDCSTIRGRVEAKSLTSSDSIFTSPVRVEDDSVGFLRFCVVEIRASRLPVRFRCHQACSAGESMFVSERFGDPSYLMLAENVPSEFRRGASDQSEPGVWHDAFHPLRSGVLEARLADFTPADHASAVVYADDLPFPATRARNNQTGTR